MNIFRRWQQTSIANKMVAIASIIVAISTGVYAWVCWLQVTATLQVMRADQRAWIIPILSTTHLNVGDVIFDQAGYVNTGRTPAKRVRAEFAMEEVDPQGRPTFDFHRLMTRSDTNVAFPNRPDNLGVPLFADPQGTHPVVYTEDLQRQFKAGNITFLIYGRISYDDVFGVRHWITYCSITAPASTGLQPERRAGDECATYNDTDSDSN